MHLDTHKLLFQDVHMLMHGSFSGLLGKNNYKSGKVHFYWQFHLLNATVTSGCFRERGKKKRLSFFLTNLISWDTAGYIKVHHCKGILYWMRWKDSMSMVQYIPRAVSTHLSCQFKKLSQSWWNPNFITILREKSLHTIGKALVGVGVSLHWMRVLQKDELRHSIGVTKKTKQKR